MFGLDGIIHKWLLNVKLVNVSMAFTSVWRYMGFNFIVFLGAIQSISNDIYEAADIDGPTNGISLSTSFGHLYYQSLS